MIIVDGNCVGASGGCGNSAYLDFVVLERVGSHFHLAGFRSGKVSLEEGAVMFLGSQRINNNTEETEAFGHALGRAFSLGEEEGDLHVVCG